MSTQDVMRELTVRWTKAQPIVAAFIRSIVPDFHESEDLVQEVAEGVAANFDQYDPSRSFVAWAIGIARHKITDHQRRRARDRHVFDSEAMMRIAEAYASGQDELEPMKEALEHCLKQTRGRARKLLEMRYTREMPLARIADKLGISINLVAVSLYRTRQALGRCIEQRIASEVAQ